MQIRTKTLLAALKDVAWADGVLRPQEARFFLDVISQLKLPAEDAAQIFRDVLSDEPSTNTNASALDDDDKKWVLGFGYLMAAADGDVDAKELAVLRGLADRFGVTWDRAEALFTEARSVDSIVSK